MKYRTHGLLTATALLLCSCIPAVNSFYSEHDLAFDARLLGAWQESDTKDEPQVWTFERAETNAYKLTVVEPKGKRGEFNAHLFKLKEDYFLDLRPAACDYATNQADLVASAMFPGHLLLRVPQLAPELKLAMTDFDWLEKHLKENPKALAHHLEDNAIVLTAETGELQQFVLAHLGKDEFFKEPGTLIRSTNSVTAASSSQH